jgi:hypothetical protein
MQCNGNFYTNGKFEEQNGNYELIITLSTTQNTPAKTSLLVKDKNSKIVGKLTYYSKEKPADNYKIKYKIVNVTLGSAPSNPVELSKYIENGEFYNFLNNNSFNQAFFQFKYGNYSELTISDEQIQAKGISFDTTTNKLDGAENNRYSILELLETEYKKTGGTIENDQRIIFLINNREMNGNVLGYASSPKTHDNKGYSTVVMNKALTDWETITHELGHTFGLLHPFDTAGFVQGSSANFMDYSSRKKMFWLWQCKIINIEF